MRLTLHHEHEADELNGVYKVRKKLSLDNYSSILASGDYNVLTVRELNQILSIHGFKQLRRVKKLELVEAVSTMDLKDFSRSTLAECIQPAPMSPTDVMKDLTQLNWQTCPVVSVRSINSAHDNSMASSTCAPKAFVDHIGVFYHNCRFLCKCILKDQLLLHTMALNFIPHFRQDISL